MKTYSAVIPVFNEEKSIKPLYERLKPVMEKLGASYEIIFVDDGSSDSSYELLKNIALCDDNAKVIGFARNFGQHNAVVAGILQSEGEYIITMDADLQNPPEEVLKLQQEIKKGFDMVSGYRRIRKDTISRRMCSSLANLIISIRTGVWLKDYGSMLRIFKRDCAMRLADEFGKNRGYITMLAAKAAHNICEIEVNHDERYSGSSKYGFKRLFGAFLRAIFCRSDSRQDASEPLFIIKSIIEDKKEHDVGLQGR
jgi:glycosyltransferase involved in cell wall biosynthesis